MLPDYRDRRTCGEGPLPEDPQPLSGIPGVQVEICHPMLQEQPPRSGSAGTGARGRRRGGVEAEPGRPGPGQRRGGALGPAPPAGSRDAGPSAGHKCQRG